MGDRDRFPGLSGDGSFSSACSATRCGTTTLSCGKHRKLVFVLHNREERWVKPLIQGPPAKKQVMVADPKLRIVDTPPPFCVFEFCLGGNGGALVVSLLGVHIWGALFVWGGVFPGGPNLFLGSILGLVQNWMFLILLGGCCLSLFLGRGGPNHGGVGGHVSSFCWGGDLGGVRMLCVGGGGHFLLYVCGGMWGLQTCVLGEKRLIKGCAEALQT